MSAKKKEASGETALAERPATDLSTDQVEFLANHEGSGFEHTGANDVLMPRFVVLQDLSPQINPRKPEYVEGAKAGMILNVATGQLAEAIQVLPVFYERRFIEWKPNRGGFVQDHGTDESVMSRVKGQNEQKFDVLDNGNLIVPTATWYVLDLANGGDKAIITMARTQLRPSRAWMSLATSEKLDHPQRGKFTPPLFYRSYKLGTVLRDNGDNEWFVWSAQRDRTVLELADEFPGLMNAAITFKDLLVKGEIKASAESFADHGEEGVDSGAAKGKDGAY